MDRLEEADGCESSLQNTLRKVPRRIYRDQGENRNDECHCACPDCRAGEPIKKGSLRQVVGAINEDLHILSTHISQTVRTRRMDSTDLRSTLIAHETRIESASGLVSITN